MGFSRDFPIFFQAYITCEEAVVALESRERARQNRNEHVLNIGTSVCVSFWLLPGEAIFFHPHHECLK